MWDRVYNLSKCVLLRVKIEINLQKDIVWLSAKEHRVQV